MSVGLNDWQYRPTPTSVVFSPDGSKVAIAYQQGFLMIYDMALRQRTVWQRAFLDSPSSMLFTPDGQRLMAASATYLKQADATTGEELGRSLLPGPRDVTRMTYTEDGRWLLISHPRSLTVLDAQTLRVAVADLPLPTEVLTDAFAMAAGPDHQLLVGTGSVLASIEMDPDRWQSAACELAGRKLTKDEWTRFLPSTPFTPACR